MARPCATCSRVDVRGINSQIMQGVPLATVAAQTGISESAIRRHAGNHLHRLDGISEIPDATTDLVDRLARVLDDLDRVRLDAIATGKGETVIRASSTAVRTIEVLAERFGVDDLDVQQLLREGQSFAQAIALAARSDPAAARVIERHLRDIDADIADELANGLDAIERQQSIADHVSQNP